ncbi:MAG: DegV family protein [Anaeroplasmataceae bacterium]
MMKRIIADTSTGCLDYYKHNYDIKIIRLKIDLNSKLYSDGDEMMADEFYELINNDSTILPKTTQPSVGELVEQFEKYAEDGYEEVIVTTISSKLSGTFNAVCQAANMVEDKIKIVPFDTKTVCFNEGNFALEAAKMIEEGLETDKIISNLEKMRDNNKIFFAVNSLEYLIKNGRLSGAAGFLGKVLKIKPILEVVEDGSIQAVEKIRTTKKALEGLCDRVSNYVAGRKHRIYIVCTGKDLIPVLEELIKEKLNLENLMIASSSPVVGCHVGGNALGLGVFLEE